MLTCAFIYAHMYVAFYPLCIVVFSLVHIPVRSSTGHRTPMYISVCSLSRSSVLHVHVIVQSDASLFAENVDNGFTLFLARSAQVHGSALAGTFQGAGMFIFLCTRVFT